MSSVSVNKGCQSRSLVVVCVLGDRTVSVQQSSFENVRYIEELTHIVESDDSDSGQTTITAKFRSDLDDMVFMKVIANMKAAVYDFVEIIEMLSMARKYFHTVEISQKIMTALQCWIGKLGKAGYVWSSLTNKPDYNLELLRSRFYPFFHVRSKTWRQVAYNARANVPDNYPPTELRIFEKGSDEAVDNHDFKTEVHISKKHNNFMSYDVLSPSKYVKIEDYARCVVELVGLNLHCEALETFMRLCVSPSHCHIVKSESAWSAIQPLVQSAETKNIIMYCVYYAYYILRHESTRMFSQVNRSYRVLFTYSELAIQPDAHDLHIERDPYIQQLSDDTFVALSIPFGLREKREINSAQTFERRLFLATGGAFVGVDLKKLGASISGSILVPCVTKSPLEKLFRGVQISPTRRNSRISSHVGHYSLTPEDHEFIAYMEYYYPSYESLTDSDYTKEVITARKNLAKVNLKAYIEEKESNQDPDNRESDEAEYNTLADIDLAITTVCHKTFRETAEYLFDMIKRNCAFRGIVYMTEIETLSSFKFSIYGPGLTRPIDVFRVPYDSAKMVKKFHVPCVRMWYEGCMDASIDFIDPVDNPDSAKSIRIKCSDGRGFYIYDSGVSALKSGVNNAYKWFSCNKIPADVLLKYAQRGLTVILNKKERQALSEYISISPRWRRLACASLDIENPDALDLDIFGIMTIQHKFFHPSIVNSGIRMGLRNDFFRLDRELYYSKRQPIAYPETATKYDGNLSVKTNITTIPPSLDNIVKFVNHMRSVSSDSASDSDSDSDSD